MKTLKTTLTTTLLALGMTVGGSAFALGNGCTGIVIAVDNDTNSSVRVTRIRYFDSVRGSFRSEISANKRIADGEEESWRKRKLEGVDGANTRFEVRYRRGGANLTRTTPNIRCNDNKTFTITINQNNTLGVERSGN